MESENKAVIRRWFDEVWNEGRPELIDHLRAANAVATGLAEGSATSVGPEPFKAFFGSLRSALPDLRIQIEDILADGDKVVVRLSAEGTHTGTGFLSKPSGRKIHFTGITIARIVNGKIVEGWNNFDQLGLLTQLGLLPAPTGADRFTNAT